MADGTDGGTRVATCTGRPLACVVVNPSKPRATAAVRSLLKGELREAGYAESVWLETSVSEPGTMQARLALVAEASLVVATGDDGTVRSVAAGLTGTGTQMGIVPLGTANLTARNLGVPIGDTRAATRVAVHGVGLPTDLAWVCTEPWSDPGALPGPAPPGDPRGWTDFAPSTPLTGRAAAVPPDSPPTPADPAGSRQLSAETARTVHTIRRATRRPRQWVRPTLGDGHACMVVAGIGFGAGLVASARPALKARAGRDAYALAAMENLGLSHMDLVLSLLDEAGARCVEHLRARNLPVTNGGQFPAGITLLPQARTGDGLLDVAVIDTVAGLAGWSSLARQVLPPYAVHYSESGCSLGRMMLRHGGEVAVRFSTPALVEVDGDLLAPTQSMRVRIDLGALLVCRPTT